MKAILSITLLIGSISLYGQPNYAKPSLADRYHGGADTLRKYIAANADYPSLAVNAGRMGLSVASITITPEGIIDNAAIHNSLGADIDSAVADLLYLTEGQWLSAEDYALNQTFYVQIAFEFEKSREDECINLQGDTILEEIVILAMGYSPPGYKSNKTLNKILEKSIEKERYDEALDIINELLRRDPFNIHYYELQMLCYEKTDRVEMKSEVEGRIHEYIKKNALSLLGKPVLYGNIKIIDKLQNGTYSLRELNRDSLIIYSGKLTSVNPEIRQGKYYFFSPKGEIITTGEYLNNIPIGIWNYYNTKGQIIHSLDYSEILNTLLEEEANPLFDSSNLGRNYPMMNTNGSFAIAEVMPKFNGLDPAREFKKYISEQMVYPMFARIKRIEGRVIVQFTIDKEGRVREPVLVSRAHTDLNLEALRIIINSPNWTPGSISGTNVNVVFTFPITFRLNGGLDLIDLFY